MANFGLFIGFGLPARGREKSATQVFGELLQLLGQQAQQGNIESFEQCLMQPHGGDLGGFVLIRGDRGKLDQLAASKEFQRAITRGQLIVENLGVVSCILGDEVQTQMGVFMEAVGDLT
jgi:hypothetical protein